MENRIVGYLVMGFAVLMASVIYMFNRAMSEIVSTACGHGPACPMWGTIQFQTTVSLGLLFFVVLVSLYLIVYGDKSNPIKQLLESKPAAGPGKEPAKPLSEDESEIFELITKAHGTIFQSELVEMSGFTKVKVTRLLDKLEGQGLVERKRRGMTNVVILKR